MSITQALMNRIDTKCSAEDYFIGEDDVVVCSGLIDPSGPNWREAVRAELLGNVVELLSTPDDVTTAGEEDDFDKGVEQPAIKSLSEAMELRDSCDTSRSFMDTRNSHCPLRSEMI